MPCSLIESASSRNASGEKSLRGWKGQGWICWMGTRWTRSGESVVAAGVGGGDVWLRAGGLAAGLPHNNAPKPRPKAGFAMGARVSEAREVVNLDLGRYRGPMNRKSGKIAALVEPFEGRNFDPHYLAYFDCFNRRLFFEAHEVLEVIWLPERRKPDGAFYQGLIQLAGAFVHLQKERLGPALALFKLAAANLQSYPASHRGLNLDEVSALIVRCENALQSSNLKANPLSAAGGADFQLNLPTD